MTDIDTHPGNPAPTVRNIVRDVAERSGIDVADIYGPGLARKYSRPRNAAMYLARIKTGKSYPQIARIFGRHHTTVIDAVRAVEARPHLYPIGEPE
jgi:chromosomal replication initiator protein